MDFEKIISMLETSSSLPQIRFYKYVSEKGTGSCAKCFRLAGEIFIGNDPRMPNLPLHPNCKCKMIEVEQSEYLKQKEFKFGNMSHDKWYEWSDDKKYLWCNSFRKIFGGAIDKYSQLYNIPKQLLAAVIANEMLDWKFPDGTRLDGITGGGIGYAQIAIKTARKHGFDGTDTEIRNKLESYSGSVEVAAKILKNYLSEFYRSAQNDKLGPGFKKSDLYTGANMSILGKENLVDINFKDWLVLSMCAIWNSGIEIIYAKDRICKNNYPNAWYHAIHSYALQPYLRKLVNE